MNKGKNDLIGKTIKSLSIKGHKRGCDSRNVLVLRMTDGTVFNVIGGYGSYTGGSCDEYPETIEVQKIVPKKTKDPATK